MGVSGSGKTRLGGALAQKLDWNFLDADDFHTPENVRHMASGCPLTDAMREPWLHQLESALHVYALKGRDCVLAFSGLRRAHRQRIRTLGFHHLFIHLTAPTALLAERLARRRGHFMPAQLLASQQQAWEMPGAEENVIALDVSGDLDSLAKRMLDAVSCSPLGDH